MISKMEMWRLVCFICVFLASFFDDAIILAEVNSPPVIQASSNKYVIINQSLPERSVLNVQASDPENGTLFYSIINVTYYRNGTSQPIKAFNLQWAVKTVPNVSFDACKAAESYSFPRNLFCMDPNSNMIKTTAKYDQFKKADFSLFALTVLVMDNGIPQRNVTTKVYFRVKENCTAGATEYKNLVQKCPQSREIIKREISSHVKAAFQFIVPNNTKITRMTLDFSKLPKFKFIEEVIHYEFIYERQRKLLFRRLLVDTTLEPKLEMYLQNPIDIIGTTENISLTLLVQNENRYSLYGRRTGIELYLLDRSKDYCANSNCLSLYSVLTAVLNTDGTPECARRDGFTMKTKYSSCDVSKYFCYASQTGEANIKGVISWRTTTANLTDTQHCPYVRYALNGIASMFGNASRMCLSNSGNRAVWQHPNIDQCGYKSATTQILEDISKTNITDSNVQDISMKLDTAMSSPKDFTNRLDVKFASDAIENLVKSKKKLSAIAKDILNVTSNMMEVDITLIAQSQLKYRSSSRILSSLESLANEISIADNTSIVIVRRNVAFAARLHKETTEGIIITATHQRVTGFNLIEMLPEKMVSLRRRRTAEIQISKQMIQKAKSLKPGSVLRICSFVFENDRLFVTSSSWNSTIAGGRERRRKMQTVNSKILSAALGGLKLMNLTSAEEITGLFRHLNQKPGRTDCVFWDNRVQGGFGTWSTEGCRYDGMLDMMHRCRCNHLTNFAILLDVTGKGTPKGAALALSIVTYIGCGISMVCLVIIFLTFVVSKKLREKRSPQIVICLCFALIATLIIFLAGISAKDLKSCQAIAILIHYFVLVSFMWMAVEGFNLYLSCVRIVDTEVDHFILKSSVIAWGVPAVIVAVTMGSTKLKAYGKKNGDEWICMVTGAAFYAGYLTPILVIVVANLVMMGLVINCLRKSAQINKDREITGLAMARIVAACSVLMGTTWVIGLFAVDFLTLPIQIAFCVLNSLQGFFIFLFYGVRNSDFRAQWKSMSGCQSPEDCKNSDYIDPNKRLMAQTEKDDPFSMTKMSSGAMTKMASQKLTTEKSATLTRFVAKPSTKKGQFRPTNSKSNLVPDGGKESCKTCNSANSKTRRRPQTGKYDSPILGSLAVTAMSGTLPSFVAKPEKYGLQTNESIESSSSANVAKTRSSIGAKLVQPRSSISTKLAQPGSSCVTKLVQPGSSISTKLAQTGSSIGTKMAQPGSSIITNLVQPESCISTKLGQPGSSIGTNLAQSRSSISTKLAQPGSSIVTNLVQPESCISTKFGQPGSSIGTQLVRPGSSIGTNTKLAQPGSSKRTESRDTKGVQRYPKQKKINAKD